MSKFSKWPVWTQNNHFVKLGLMPKIYKYSFWSSNFPLTWHSANTVFSTNKGGTIEFTNYFRLYHSSDENCLTRTKKDKTSPDRKSLNLNRLKRLLSHVQILANRPKSLKDTVILKRSQKYTCNGQKLNLEQIWSLYFSWESWKQSLKQQKSSQSDWIKLQKFPLLSWILLPNEFSSALTVRLALTIGTSRQSRLFPL